MLQLTMKLMNKFSYSITIHFILNNEDLVMKITTPIVILIQCIKYALRCYSLKGVCSFRPLKLDCLT